MYAVRQVETFHPGEFNGDGDRLDVAVGMPRGANLTGKVGTWLSLLATDDDYEEAHWRVKMVVRMLSQVVLYNANLTNLNNVTGDQVK